MHELLIRIAIDVVCIGVIVFALVIALAAVCWISLKVVEIWSDYKWKQKREREKKSGL